MSWFSKRNGVLTRSRQPSELTAAVVGSGPNGIVASISLQAAGIPVTLFEARAELGGGVRSDTGPLPGFRRDVCSTVYPLGIASPVFKALGLGRFGLEWALPPTPFAHPLDDGSAVIPNADRDNPDGVGEDALAWETAVVSIADHWERIADNMLGPLRLPYMHPAVIRFGLNALRSSQGLSRKLFNTERVHALFAGVAAHTAIPLDRPATAATGLVLAGLAHGAGWPFARGGAETITKALVSLATRLGVEFVTDTSVESDRQLKEFDLRVLDTSPRSALQLFESELSARTVQRIERFRYGPGVCKVDYALSEPVPWQAESAKQAGTVHVGGTHEQITYALEQVWSGTPASEPYVLVGQPSIADSSRAPSGCHSLWAYCHVPSGFTGDVSPNIDNQIERFAQVFGTP